MKWIHNNTEIPNKSLHGTLEDHSIPRDSFIFQQDNDPKHKSRLASSWFQDKNISVLPWPANSPDMNIVEHCWGELKCYIDSRQPHARNLEELWEFVQEEWGKMDKEFLAKLYNGLPRRIEALKEADDAYTRYWIY